MTLSDFLAASPGDERLPWARWLCYLHMEGQDESERLFRTEYGRSIQCNNLLEGYSDATDVPPFLPMADAVLTELARQREADKAEIEQLTIENQRLELQVTELIWQS